MDMNDVIIQTYRSTGKGGQNVNKVESAVRAIHRPTGLVATCQDERSQQQNKQRAIDTLRQRVADYHQSLRRAALDKFRAGMYDGRVRTYDFTSNVVVDYRTKKKTSRLQEVLDGNLDLIR